MNEIGAALLGLGDKLAAHVLLSAAAIALGIAVALPLAIWASRSPAVARATLGFASLVQTIPALALLALFFPILLSLRAVFGEGLPTLGFLPALLALSLYALLPILRNAVTAQANLDPGILEAADGVGMSFWQRLRLVEAPLAAPYVMAGIRTAAVWTIGAATLSTTIGQPSLGDPIFAGLQTQNWVLVLAGCIASAGLALVADALLGTIEKGLATRRRRPSLAGLVAVLLGIVAALAVQFGNRADDRIVIGAKGFSEQYILARLIGQQLETAGYTVDYRNGLGSAVAHQAVANGAIDVLVDYTGTIWTNQMERRDTPDRDTMLAEIEEWETRTTGTHVLGRLGFENAYGLAMPRARAEAGGFAAIGDLAARGQGMTIGGDPEFFERPEWIAVRDAYGLRFAAQRNFSPTFMYN
ncbi:MAG: ABC transporter permease/substrate-binding protein, partial [Pseudomonadota bacterium]|nr:ABC transporter permease/substrate-binding protein [Pseudomonadota bacterium]